MNAQERDSRLALAASAIIQILGELATDGVLIPDETGAVSLAVVASEVAYEAFPGLGRLACTPVLAAELRIMPTRPTKATMGVELDTFGAGTPREATVDLLALARRNNLLRGGE